MTANEFVEYLIANTKWSELQVSWGNGDHVGDALRSLISASTQEEIDANYWRIDNYVVVQGAVYESAVAVVPVILAAIIGDSVSIQVRLELLELLFQIVHSETAADSNVKGVDEHCRNAARNGLWLLYREMYCTTDAEIRNTALEILKVLEVDEVRRCLLTKWSVGVSSAAPLPNATSE